MLLTTSHLTDNAKVVHLFTLGGYLFEAFDRTKDRTQSFEYLDESIMHHREVLCMENAQLFHFNAICWLIENLSIRWRSFRQRSDLNETMELFAKGVKDSHATAPF